MNIFELLGEVKDAKVTSEVVNQGTTIELYGTILVKKGVLSIEVSYWCREMYEVEFADYIQVGDYDHETNYYYINGLKIDSMNKFRQGLVDHGMSSVSELLNISNNEILDQIFNTLPTTEDYKKQFGDRKMWRALSFKEKRYVVIDSIRKGNKVPEYIKKQLEFYDEEGIMLTDKQILEL